MLDSPQNKQQSWQRTVLALASGRRPPGAESCMEPQVTLNVTFKNETQSFLVSNPENTTWADVEAMVKVSFDLNTIQIKYLDEENEEVKYIMVPMARYPSIVKMAVKQGNQLQMQVYEGYCVVNEAPPRVGAEKRPVARTGKKPLAHYSSLVRVLGSDTKTPEEPAAQQFPPAPCDADQPQDKPPDWFTSYLETFREQVVKETVEKLEQKLHEKLVLQNPSLGSCPSEVSMPVSEETLFLPENQFNWQIACSNCQRRIIGVRYQCRLQKQVDKNFLKAEKQRLRAEKKQRKAEVKELKKQLKLHRKIHLWNSINGLQSPRSPLGRPESLLQSNTLTLPLQPCAPMMPTLSAAFVDENLPDGTHLQPGTKFIKHWRMKNTGNVKWSTDTKLKFMWGNLTLASTEKKDVLVPCLKAGHVGVVSVEFVAPALEGTYTSHWRLSHKGQQFGPRVWCSIIVDPFPSTESPGNNEKGMNSSSKADDLTCQQEEAFLLAKKEIQPGETSEQTEGTGTCIPQKAKNVASERELYIPSVDLLTAQDLLSFELLDINIVQELERVPHNTPVESTVSVKKRAEKISSVEEAEDDLSGTQFVCETVIRSLTLDAAPDHKPPCRQKSPNRAEFQLHATEEQQPAVLPGFCSKESSLKFASPGEGPLGDEREEIVHIAEEEAVVEEEEDELKDEVQSQSSASSEDYIIILPECFDTSRPLGDSMYSSALSQPGLERGAEGEPGVEAGQEPAEAGESTPGGENQPPGHSISDILMTSQTLDTVPLTPEVVGPPLRLPRCLFNLLQYCVFLKGVLLVPSIMVPQEWIYQLPYRKFLQSLIRSEEPIVSEDQTAALMAHLFEMGFCDRQLNLRLLKKHNYNILQVVTELLQVNNNDWYSHRY
ncbi:next to BRCA1 gene 1 protein [Camelus ferus]|nr:next to BRCA1 gene 1 protein [Camelus ferus]